MRNPNLGASPDFREAADSLREALTDRAAPDDPNGMGPGMRPTYDVQAGIPTGCADDHDREPIVFMVSSMIENLR